MDESPPWRSPETITEDIRAFCRTLSLQEPVFLSYSDRGFEDKQSDCHVNVRGLTERQGGRQQHGWLILLWNRKYYLAQYHSVWLSPQGELLDVTPHRLGHDRMIFLPDNERTIDWHNTGMLLWANVFYDSRTGRRWYDGEDGQVDSREHPRMRCFLLPDGRCLLVTKRVKKELRLPDLPT